MLLSCEGYFGWTSNETLSYLSVVRAPGAWIEGHLDLPVVAKEGVGSYICLTSQIESQELAFDDCRSWGIEERFFKIAEQDFGVFF